MPSGLVALRAHRPDTLSPCHERTDRVDRSPSGKLPAPVDTPLVALRANKSARNDNSIWTFFAQNDDMTKGQRASSSTAG